MNLFEWLEGTWIAIWVGESLWGYPIMLALHAVGLATVVGIMIMVDLRLLNHFAGIRIEALSQLMKFAWSGFLINAFSGFALFTSQATTFVDSTAFLIKITLIFLAVLIGASIQLRLGEAGSFWDIEGQVPEPVKRLAAASIGCWLGAIIAGRLIAYFI